MTMSTLYEQDMLNQDRDDVIEVLRIRFHNIPEEIVDSINNIQQLEVLQRLVLVAANAADWNVFLEELQEGEASFRLLGERFDPIDHDSKKG